MYWQMSPKTLLLLAWEHPQLLSVKKYCDPLIFLWMGVPVMLDSVLWSTGEIHLTSDRDDVMKIPNFPWREYEKHDDEDSCTVDCRPAG